MAKIDRVRTLSSVVVATDFSESSERCLRRLVHLPLAPEARITLVHVLPRSSWQLAGDRAATLARGALQEVQTRVREEHEGTVAEHGTWGVPTFAVGDQASFVRLMDRPRGDGDKATRTIERVLDLLDWPELNEFKHPTLPR